MSRKAVVGTLSRDRDTQVVRLKPLTERILTRLPGPRPFWIAVWMLVPWLNLTATLMLQAAGELPVWENPAIQFLNRVAFSFAILVAMWGAARVTRGLESLRPRLSRLVEEGTDPLEPFRGIDSTAAPVWLTVVTVILFAGEAVVEHDSWARAIVTGGSWLAIGIVLWSFAWAYLSLQIGLHGLGRRHLSLDPYPGDRSLGLRPVGRLAFTGFWSFVAMLSPLLLVSGSDRFGLSIGLLVLLGGVAVFFLSLRRLNRQMVASKERELAWARDLYAQAFEPVRAESTLEALQRQSGLLSAAEALEKRAERIQEWPFDEGMFARVVAISSTVAAAVVTRLLLLPLGL